MPTTMYSVESSISYSLYYLSHLLKSSIFSPLEESKELKNSYIYCKNVMRGTRGLLHMMTRLRKQTVHTLFNKNKQDPNCMEIINMTPNHVDRNSHCVIHLQKYVTPRQLLPKTLQHHHPVSNIEAYKKT